MGEALSGVILKICGKRKGGGYKNSDAVEKTITYVLRENARKKDDLWGSIGTFAKTGDGMIRDFYKLKRLHGKEGGTQVKHLVLSWGRRPEIPRKKMRKLLVQTLGYWGRNYQVVYAVHEDHPEDRYHMHIVLNSVSNDGHKIQITGKEKKEFRNKFNKIWNPYGYHLARLDKNGSREDKSYDCSE